MTGDLICSLLLLMVNSENKKLRSVHISHAKQVPVVDLLSKPQATSMHFAAEGPDVSEGSLCNRSQKHISLPAFQGSVLGHQYSTDRKDLEKIYSLEVSELFLFKKRTAPNNLIRTAKSKAQGLQAAASKAAI